MQVKATTKYIHNSPRKLRLVANAVKGLNVSEAEKQLMFMEQKGGAIISKTLKSAVSSATHNFSLDKDNLYIFNARVDKGPVMKRWRAAAFGVAHPIIRKTSHFTLILEERVKGKKSAKKVETEKVESAPMKEKAEKEEKSTFGKKGYETKETKLKKQGKGFVNKIFRRKSGT